MIGIDPGKQGIIALSDGNFFKIPYLGKEIDTRMVNQILFNSGHGIAIIEKPFPGSAMSKAAVLQMGINYGKLLQCLIDSRFRVIEVAAASWKKKLNLDKDKAKSILLCQKLFPKVNLARSRSGKLDDNIAEAFLLIEYARRFCNEISD